MRVYLCINSSNSGRWFIKENKTLEENGGNEFLTVHILLIYGMCLGVELIFLICAAHLAYAYMVYYEIYFGVERNLRNFNKC